MAVAAVVAKVQELQDGDMKEVKVGETQQCPVRKLHV